MTDLNTDALINALVEIAETLERTVKEVERLRGVVYEDHRLRERYLSGVKRLDDDVNERTVHLLVRRLRELKK